MKASKLITLAVSLFVVGAIAFTSCSKSEDLSTLQSKDAVAALRAAKLDSTILDSLAFHKHHHHGVCDSIKVYLRDSLSFSTRHHHEFKPDSLKTGNPHHGLKDSLNVKPPVPNPGGGHKHGGFPHDSIPNFPVDTLGHVNGGHHGGHGGGHGGHR
jgi:hypothetical protein